MNLIALLCTDPQLSHTLSHFRKASLDLYLHPVTHADIGEVSRSLAPMGFAGALVLDEAQHARAYGTAQRSSLDAHEVGAADTLSVSIGGLLAEYNLGRAVGAALQNRGWDARGANVVLLGEGALARAACRELSSLGSRSPDRLSHEPPHRRDDVAVRLRRQHRNHRPRLPRPLSAELFEPRRPLGPHRRTRERPP